MTPTTRLKPQNPSIVLCWISVAVVTVCLVVQLLDPSWIASLLHYPPITPPSTCSQIKSNLGRIPIQFSWVWVSFSPIRPLICTGWLQASPLGILGYQHYAIPLFSHHHSQLCFQGFAPLLSPSPFRLHLVRTRERRRPLGFETPPPATGVRRLDLYPWSIDRISTRQVPWMVIKLWVSTLNTFHR